MVQHYLEALGPALAVAAFFYIFTLNWSRRQTWARAVTCGVVLFVSVRYLTWRLTSTVWPVEAAEGAAFWWVWLLFLVEALAFMDIMLFLVAMSRYADRSVEADRLQVAWSGRPVKEWPTVDVFIPTYNEPLDVLERTIVGALALDYPADKLKVYVLDDQRREWLRALCADKGAIHVTRPDNAHAKAGNMNHGLTVSSGDHIAVFDADFVPYRNFLRRTLPFFSDPAIGIVQTPQHFFNSDPVQTNLSLERVWPDEQRLFFDEMATSRDAWDVSFCCGSCSVIRREALEAIGGFPTESITEDLLTTLAMLNKGYKTRYLNERLSMGLAAENLKGYFVQRERWCQGAIQTLFVANGPLRGPGLTPFQRVMFMPVSWLSQYVVRLAILVVPAVYLWTGIAPFYLTDLSEIVFFQLPVLVAYLLLMAWLTPTRYLPLVSSAVGTFSTFRMLPVVVSSLVRPFGKPFQVTPKGSSNEQNAFDAYTFACIAMLVGVTALGLVINVVPEWSRIGEGEFSVVSGWWAAINIAVLMIAALICFEKPKPTIDTFKADETVGLLTERGPVGGRLVIVGLDRAVVELPAPATVGQQVIVGLHGVPQFSARVGATALTRRRKVPRAELAFTLEGEARDSMIVKLYTGGYSQDVPKLDRSVIAGRLWLRLFGASARSAGATSGK